MPARRVFKRLSVSEPFQQLRSRLEQKDRDLKLRGLPGSLTAFSIAQASKSLSHPVLVVCSDSDRAENLRDDLEKILDDEYNIDHKVGENARFRPADVFAPDAEEGSWCAVA